MAPAPQQQQKKKATKERERYQSDKLLREQDPTGKLTEAFRAKGRDKQQNLKLSKEARAKTAKKTLQRREQRARKKMSSSTPNKEPSTPDHRPPRDMFQESIDRETGVYAARRGILMQTQENMNRLLQVLEVDGRMEHETNIEARAEARARGPPPALEQGSNIALERTNINETDANPSDVRADAVYPPEDIAKSPSQDGGDGKIPSAPAASAPRVQFTFGSSNPSAAPAPDYVRDAAASATGFLFSQSANSNTTTTTTGGFGRPVPSFGVGLGSNGAASEVVPRSNTKSTLNFQRWLDNEVAEPSTRRASTSTYDENTDPVAAFDMNNVKPLPHDPTNIFLNPKINSPFLSTIPAGGIPMAFLELTRQLGTALPWEEELRRCQMVVPLEEEKEEEKLQRLEWDPERSDVPRKCLALAPTLEIRI